MKEGDKCPGCGSEWKHREGDGGKDGPLSCYHKTGCEFGPPPAPPGATEERASR